MTSFSGTFQIPRYTEKWFIKKKQKKSLRFQHSSVDVANYGF